MQYFSLNNNAKAVGFEKAVRFGLAPDRGLYFPQQIDALGDSFWDNFLQIGHHEIALKVIEQFVGGEIPKYELQKIIKEYILNIMVIGERTIDDNDVYIIVEVVRVQRLL